MASTISERIRALPFNSSLALLFFVIVYLYQLVGSNRCLPTSLVERQVRAATLLPVGKLVGREVGTLVLAKPNRKTARSPRR
jgi:hypothetical protein